MHVLAVMARISRPQASCDWPAPSGLRRGRYFCSAASSRSSCTRAKIATSLSAGSVPPSCTVERPRRRGAHRRSCASMLPALRFGEMYRSHPYLRLTRGKPARERRRADSARDNRARSRRDYSDRRAVVAGGILKKVPQRGNQSLRRLWHGSNGTSAR
jgi:hypothetical protein